MIIHVIGTRSRVIQKSNLIKEDSCASQTDRGGKTRLVYYDFGVALPTFLSVFILNEILKKKNKIRTKEQGKKK